MSDVRVATVSPGAVYEAFDPVRLTQARNLAGLTKRALAERVGVTPAAVTQYESGLNRPRPDVIPDLAEVLGVPMAFFVAGRPQARLDVSAAHFRSLRNTRAYQRAKAIAYVEQAWELTNALEKRVELPAVDLPGFAGGGDVDLRAESCVPVEAARALRQRWGLGTGPLTHLVRQMEAHGIVVLTPSADGDLASVDGYSTARLPRPVVVLTPNRADDVYRHRFSAAHELGHLVLHGEAVPGDAVREREADVFAAEFLTPAASIRSELPARVDLRRLSQLRGRWGVSVHSLVYRCRELGLCSDASARRAYQRLRALHDAPGFAGEPLSQFQGERAALLNKAFDLASDRGLSVGQLARELAWTVPQVRAMLGIEERRPVLTLL